MYDYDLQIPDITVFKNAFVESMTRETPDIDAMATNFQAIVDAFEKLTNQAEAIDVIRAGAKDRIFNLNEMLNKRMNEIISDDRNTPDDDRAAAAQRAEDNALSGFFDLD